MGLVLGELIGINDTWIRRRFAIKDCNTAIAGAYNVDDSTTNNFPTGAYKFGTLLVANSGFFGSQYFVPDNFNADPYIYIRSIGNNGTTFNKWAKIKVTIITYIFFMERPGRTDTCCERNKQRTCLERRLYRQT